MGGLLRLFFRADSQASVRKKGRGVSPLLLPAPPRADAGAQVPKRSGRYDGHGEARRTGPPAGIAGAVGVSSKLRSVEVVMGCSTLIGRLSVAGSGQHRRGGPGGAAAARPCQSHDDCAVGGTCVSSDDVAWALALQGDGKVVAAGERRACVGGEHDGERCQVDADCGAPPDVCVADFALARYNADGSVDLTFGSGGPVVTDFAGDDAAFAPALHPDEGIVVAGGPNGAGNMDFAPSGREGDGRPDGAFALGSPA